mmetsp:Transcript_14432/g.38631  ORF Transcript_14432/g.38631 Transcript_14432/m.38631 type:complete len:329 (-) Transcript_14432:92-1078(-)
MVGMQVEAAFALGGTGAWRGRVRRSAACLRAARCARVRERASRLVVCIVRADEVLEPAGPMVSELFRSQKSDEFKREREIMSENGMVIAQLLAKFDRNMSSPNDVEKKDMLKLAQLWEDAGAAARALRAKASFVGDFVSLQEFALQDAQARRLGSGITSVTINDAMDFQIQTLRCIATDTIPPRPSDEVMKFFTLVQQKGKVPSVFQTSPPMSVISRIVAGLSGVALDEQKQLMREHEQLVSFGSSYGSFDRVGKLAFLDAMEGVEERWRLMLKRLELTGELSQLYADESRKIVNMLGLRDAADYRLLVREARDIMRADANALEYSIN